MAIPFNQLPYTAPADALPSWAQRLSTEQRQTLIETALHEAAHLVASLAVNGGWASIFIRPYPDRNGRLGRAYCGLALYVEEEAFCDAAGLAWEELHGDPRTARHDADSGSGRIGTAAEWAHILCCARRFVQAHEQVIRTCATGLLNALPSSYTVSPTKSDKLLTWIALHVRRVPLAVLQGEVFQDLQPSRMGKDGAIAWAPEPPKRPKPKRRATADTHRPLFPSPPPTLPTWYGSEVSRPNPRRFKLPARVQSGALFMQPG